MSFGQRLRLRRKQLGYTQQALADLLDVEQSTVSIWEGQIDPPTDQARLTLLASALRWTKEELLGLVSENNHPLTLDPTEQEVERGKQLLRDLPDEARRVYLDLLEILARGESSGRRVAQPPPAEYPTDSDKEAKQG